MAETPIAPTCLRCGGATRYEGRVEQPPQNIFRCGSCGGYLWVRTTPRRNVAALPEGQRQQTCGSTEPGEN